MFDSGRLRGMMRILHWGPLINYGIIFTVSTMALHFIMMWWPPLESVGGAVNLGFFLLWTLLTVYNHMAAMALGPGFVPKGWKPTRKEDEKNVQYCKLCEGFKSPRSHHCRKCDRCVMKMDHHCPWINTCCGHRNHANFTYFLFFAPIGCIHASVILIRCVYLGITRVSYYRDFGRPPPHNVVLGLYSLVISLFATGLAVGVVIAVGALLFIQLKSIITNKTGIELYIIDKAIWRRSAEAQDRIEEAEDNGEEDIPPFVYPYDLGWKKNMTFVFLHSGPEASDGCYWPVLEGSGQFDFTKEQLMQKRQKEERVTRMRAVKAYRGSWCPFGFGCKTCYKIPCTDEARVRVAPGDVFMVSRYRSHWLYGTKVLSDEDIKKGVKRMRGWFPRQCVDPAPVHDKHE